MESSLFKNLDKVLLCVSQTDFKFILQPRLSSDPLKKIFIYYCVSVGGCTL